MFLKLFPMNQEQKNKIANELNKRISILKCPMCQHGSFVMLDGYVLQPVSENLKSITIGGSSIPMTAIVCNNCGYVSFHALGAIGMLNNMEENDSINPQSNQIGHNN